MFCKFSLVSAAYGIVKDFTSYTCIDFLEFNYVVLCEIKVNISECPCII